jgi:4-alpha-glucanotransferase
MYFVGWMIAMGVFGERCSGTLLHISVLPSRFGIGDFGPAAYHFVDALAEAGHRYWQVLPLNPTTIECGSSPYASESAYAGNLLFISPEKLAEEGLIDNPPTLTPPESNWINYEEAEKTKKALLRRAYTSFRKHEEDYADDYCAFEKEHSGWLEDYALYKTLLGVHGVPWYLWPVHHRRRETGSLKAYHDSESVRFHKFCQYIFFRQWGDLKRHCREKGIGLIGDLPYYFSHDSADVWANPSDFKLDSDYKPVSVSGVPPDSFSASGQLWGHPVYNWKRIQEGDFSLWMDRIKHCLKLYDVLRIDHFRGLLAYWEVPAGETTAIKGGWTSVPSEPFFNTLSRRFPSMPFIAEDLGMITEDVKLAMKRLGLPGMRVLIFGFDGNPDNPHLPNNHPEGCVAYTGTHDTNTARGWFIEEASEDTRQNLFNCIGSWVTEGEVSWALMRLASGSKARLSVFPIQDILSLGSESRMNRPAKAKDNYLWKLTETQLKGIPTLSLKEMAAESDRL